MSTNSFTYNINKLARIKRHSKNLWLVFLDIQEELKKQREVVRHLLVRQEDLVKKTDFKDKLPELVKAECKVKELQNYFEGASKKYNEFKAVSSELETAVEQHFKNLDSDLN